jgi:hypothetical protein
MFVPTSAPRGVRNLTLVRNVYLSGSQQLSRAPDVLSRFVDLLSRSTPASDARLPLAQLPTTVLR